MSTEVDRHKAEGNLFDRQLELLKMELELVNSTIRQLDDITKGIKNWAIVVWTGSVGLGLSTANLHKFLWLTGLIPLLFWIVDASYRRHQRTFIVRMRDISDFVNSSEFDKSARDRLPFSFKLLQMRTKKGKKTDLLSVMMFRTVWILYLGLIVLSVLLWLLCFVLNW